MPKRVDYYNEDYNSDYSDYDSTEESSSENGHKYNCGYDSSDSEIYDEDFDEYGNYIRPSIVPAIPSVEEQIDKCLSTASREKWVVLSTPKTIYSGPLPPWGWKSMPEYAHFKVWPFENSVQPEPIVEQPAQIVQQEQKPTPKTIWRVESVEKTDLSKLIMEEESKQNIPIIQPVPVLVPSLGKQKDYSSSPKDLKVKSLLSRPTAPVRDQKRINDRNDYNNHADARNDCNARNNRGDSRNTRNDRSAPRARLLGNPREKVMDNKEPPNTNASITTTTLEKRFDLLCYNKEGHDVSCKYVHSTEQWNPKICRFKENCQKIDTCPFWHREKENKLQYISRCFSIKDSFFAKHKREFKAKYLS